MSTTEQQAKLPLGILSFPAGMPGLSPNYPKLVIQLPTNASGKQQKKAQVLAFLTSTEKTWV